MIPPDVMDSLYLRILRRRGVRQFVKFCIVGASSTAINFAVYWWLLYRAQLAQTLQSALTGWPEIQAVVVQYGLHVQLAATLAFLVAVSNGFLWNSRWTFRHAPPAGRTQQYVRFVLVNTVGLVLNLTIVSLVMFFLMAGRPPNPDGPEPLIAMAVATVLVAAWNFLANKYWTFKA